MRSYERSSLLFTTKKNQYYWLRGIFHTTSLLGAASEVKAAQNLSIAKHLAWRV